MDQSSSENDREVVADGTRISTGDDCLIVDFLISNGLQDYIKVFSYQEIGMQELMLLTDEELLNLIPKIGHWSRVCKARKRYMEVEPCGGKLLNINEETTLPFANLGEFFAEAGIDSVRFLPIFDENGIGLQELCDLPDDMLREVITKTGPWSKICSAKRTLINSIQTDGATANGQGNQRTCENEDALETFLKELQLEPKYVKNLKEQELDFDDILSISEPKLMTILGKMGPVERILRARENIFQSRDEQSSFGYSPMDFAQEDDMEQPFSEEENANTKTLNILLLGETGVGKSTFINAFANYLTFGSMEAAHQNPSGIFALIPTSFAVTDDNFKRHTIKVGTDDNENKDEGQSATQVCRSYYFRFSDTKIRLIDTPGIGDTRGIEQDKKNLENILAFISQHEELHGICFLMTPNISRLTASFTFCLKELLCHLQKDAARNIMFVFTNSRGTFYKPGDTAVPLSKVLEEIASSPPYVSIPFVHSTTYCFDNEAFRFLLAIKEGLSFKEDQHLIFSESWRVSVRESMRMMAYINGLIPHKVHDTVSINEARQLIIQLSKPIAEFTQNINVNLQVINDRREELLLSDQDVRKLRAKLNTPVVDLVQHPLNEPTTVCTAARCIQVHTVPGRVSKINYITKCHSPCQLSGVQAEVLNNSELRNCWAMLPSGGKYCQVCCCRYEKHMHIYYELVETETYIEDKTVKELIAAKANDKEIITKTIERLEARSAQLDIEKNLLTKTIAKFAVFLKTNAIAPYNDAYKEYLEHLISNEKMKKASGAKNQLVIDGMQQALLSYNEEKRLFDTVLSQNSVATSSSSGDRITAANIKQLEQELYSMEIYGPQLKAFRHRYAAAREQAQRNFFETVHDPPKRCSLLRLINKAYSIGDYLGIGSQNRQPRRLAANKNGPSNLVLKNTN